MASKSKSNRIVGVMPASERDWQAEDDLRTLQRAIEIEKDPKRYAAAKKLAKEKLAEIKEITSDTEIKEDAKAKK